MAEGDTSRVAGSASSLPKQLGSGSLFCILPLNSPRVTLGPVPRGHQRPLCCVPSWASTFVRVCPKLPVTTGSLTHELLLWLFSAPSVLSFQAACLCLLSWASWAAVWPVWLCRRLGLPSKLLAGWTRSSVRSAGLCEPRGGGAQTPCPASGPGAERVSHGPLRTPCGFAPPPQLVASGARRREAGTRFAADWDFRENPQDFYPWHRFTYTT